MTGSHPHVPLISSALCSIAMEAGSQGAVPFAGVGTDPSQAEQVARAGASQAMLAAGERASQAMPAAGTDASSAPSRLSRLPSTGLSKPPRKKPGPKKKVAGASSAPTPTPTTAPNFCAMEASNFASEDSAQNLFDQMPGSSQTYTEWMTGSVGSVVVEDIHLTQQFPSVDEEIEEITPPTKKRGQRAANYSTDEDEALIMAWQSVSLDAAVGVDQTLSTYWSRISEQFHRNVKTPSNRSIGSLQHRWSIIQDCCNKWASCKKEIERLHPSGVPLQDQVNYIQERYKQLDRLKHRPFTMLHCWALLQHNEKWRDRDQECPPKKPQSNNSSSLEFGNNENGDEEDEARGRSPTPSSGPGLRPPGRKQEKDRKKKEGHAGGYKEAIQEMIEIKKQLAVDKDARWMDIKAIEERKVAIEERKAAIEERKAAAEEGRLRIKDEKALAKKKEQHQKIMFMDTSALDDTQRAFVQAMRAQIMEEMLGGGRSRSSP